MFRPGRCPTPEQLARHLAGASRPRQHRRLEGHLSTCAHCRREAQALRQLDRLLTSLTPPAAPAELPSQVLRRVRQELGARVPRRAVIPRFALGGAALAVLLLVSVHALRPPSGPSSGPAPAVVLSPPSLPVTPTPPRTVASDPAPRRAASPAAARPREPRLVHTPRRTVRTARLGPVERPVHKVPVAAPRVANADRALGAATRFASVGDTELQAATLENLAVAYPQSRQAARALLTAAELYRAHGNLAEADAAYRRVATMPTSSRLGRALAYKALGDLRRQLAGDDETAQRHYRQAAAVLQEETRSAHGAERARALLVLGDVEQTLGHPERATAAYAEAAACGSTTAVTEETGQRLAQVL